MAKPRQCPECGAALPPEAPGGACPFCALREALAVPDEALEPGLTEKPGDRIGHYKLLEQIGEGGCGVVYMAEQTEPVRRRVALKIVKLGMDTKQVIARFEAERQALALMDHPNIAKIFDAGVTGTGAPLTPPLSPSEEERVPQAGAGSPPLRTPHSPLATHYGRPYFVMELVRGIKITDYCDQTQLDTKGRLDLFMQVCHAVQHAHQKGIIHRDLKPSNILVTLHDGVPVPKVIDFGIAKATQQPLTDKTLFTSFQQFVGTPAYMSPEQAELSGLDIDTRSDIYSLGVLLYELLTGRLPFEQKELVQAGLDEMRRLIREQDPPRPSTRLSTLGDAELSTTARQRQIEPPKLIKLVRGDLDWIVMKCLEKDRVRRYPTADSLADDLVRHLKDEPISARPPSRLHRLEKLAKRNRLAFAAAGTVAFALVAGLGFSSWMFLRENRARQSAEARAYASDMGLAARAADLQIGMGTVARILSAWRDHKPDLRGWEWHYLNGLCHHEAMSLPADTNGLWSVAWSPDGKRLATGGADGTVKLWDALTSQRTVTLYGHSNEVRAVAWSPDGKRLASASLDKTIRIWDAQSGSDTSTLRGHTGDVLCVAWSPDGLRLASGSADGTVKVWNTGDGTEGSTIRTQGRVQALSWNSSGTRLAGAGTIEWPHVPAAGTVEWTKVWDPVAGKEIFSLGGPAGGSSRWTVSWSPNDQWLATGGDDGAVRIWDAATGKEVRSLWGHWNSAICVAWNSDSRCVASASRGDGTVKVWDVASGKAVRSFRGHLGAVRSLSWSPNNTQLVSASLDGTARVWDLRSDNLSHRRFHQPDQVVSLAWQPGGNKLAAGGRFTSAWVWNTSDGTGPLILPGHTNWVWAVAWNPAGTLLATADSDGIIKLWEPVTATELWSVRDASDAIRSLAWSPDNKRLASVGGAGQVKIWDAATGQHITAFQLPDRRMLAVAWSPEGRYLAAGAGPLIYVCDAQSGAKRWILRGHTDSVRSLAWSFDGRRLASAADDAMAIVWDPRSGQLIHTLHGHASPVYSVAWSPDGARLATGGWDKAVKIWNPASGMEICSLDEAQERVSSVVWSCDGTRIACSDLGGNIFVYHSRPRAGLAGPTSLESKRAPNHGGIRDLPHGSRWLQAVGERYAARGDLGALNGLAWFLATCPYQELRDGPTAISLAEKAVASTDRKNPSILDTFAAACAEAGDFPRAISVQHEAIALAQTAQARRDFLSKLKLYESNLPYREIE